MSIKEQTGFMEMMDDSPEKDEISCVLVVGYPALENAADILKSVQLLMDFDVDLVCVEDAIENSSTQGGRLTLAIHRLWQKWSMKYYSPVHDGEDAEADEWGWPAAACRIWICE